MGCSSHSSISPLTALPSSSDEIESVALLSASGCGQGEFDSSAIASDPIAWEDDEEDDDEDFVDDDEDLDLGDDEDDDLFDDDDEESDDEEEVEEP